MSNSEGNEENPIHVSRRRFLTSLALAGAAAGGGMALGGIVTPRNVAGASNFAQSPSYIIYLSSGTVYALNGMTENIDFSGTDASTVIQSALNNLTSGGLVYIREGTYTLRTTLQVPSYTTLCGAGQGTLLQTAPNTSIDVIQNQNKTNGNTKINVRHVRLDGNRSQQTQPKTAFLEMGVHFQKVTDSLVDSVAAENFRDRGFRYLSCSSSAISNCLARNCGVYQEQGFTLEGSSFCEVADCYAEACTDLNYIIAFGDHCKVVGCHSKATSGGIEIYGGEYPSPVDTPYHEVLGFTHDGGSGFAIGVNKARNTIIDGFAISNCAGGIIVHYAESQETLVSNGQIYNSSNHGVLMQDTCSHVMLRNVLVDKPHGTWVRGIYAVDWSGGSSIGGTLVGTVTDISVVGCSVRNASEIGIRFENIWRFHCLGNYVRGCGSTGIHLTGSQGGSGVPGGASSTEGVVANNHCSGNSGYGIYEDSNCNFNMFIGNHVRNNTLGKLQTTNADTNRHMGNLDYDIL